MHCTVFVVQTLRTIKKLFRGNGEVCGTQYCKLGIHAWFEVKVTTVNSHLNLEPRVLRLFGQQLVARRDSGELEFCLNFLIGWSVTCP